MRVLVTGAAGFIGFHLTKRLLEMENEVVGLDNLNEYYSVSLKEARLSELGLSVHHLPKNHQATSERYPTFSFVRMDLHDREALPYFLRITILTLLSIWRHKEELDTPPRIRLPISTAIWSVSPTFWSVAGTIIYDTSSMLRPAASMAGTVKYRSKKRIGWICPRASMPPRKRRMN